MNIPTLPTVTLPSVEVVTKTIAFLPELIRDTLAYAQFAYGEMLSREVGDDGELSVGELLDMDDATRPWEPWVSGRRALELTMLVRTQQQYPRETHEALHKAVDDLDTPQHAVDVVMALASMLAHVLDEDEVQMFGQSLVEAEARAS